METNEKNERNGMKLMALTMLMAAGADVVAPAEVRREVLEQLPLSREKKDLLIAAYSGTERDERLELVKRSIVCGLSASQLLDLRDFCDGLVKKIISYCGDHPEYRKEMSPEEAIARVFKSM